MQKLLIGLSKKLAVGLGCVASFTLPASAHGGAEGSDLKPGEYKASPILTIEGHGGLENNLQGQPRHYAIDGLFGTVLEWGLSNEGSFAIEAAIGPALVWGEAEHFYGQVHVHGAEEAHEDEHEDEDHAEEEGQDDEVVTSASPWRRTDIKGYLSARYQPNKNLSIQATYKPYYITRTQDEDKLGLRNEVQAGATYAFGDGDVNFALGDGLENIVDGIFVSAYNNTGWDSDGTYLGNYTDTWAGFGFNYDKLNVTLSGGPRFYTPGSYANLPQRTDWGGEIEFEYPIAENVVAFAHWEAIYSSQNGEGWGVGFQHHIGTGVSFRF